MNMERLFRWSALAWSALGFAVMALDPAVALQGFGHPRLPVLVHAFTLGAFVNGYYALQWGAWQRCYRQAPPWRWMALLVWAIHQGGLAIMLAGFFAMKLPVALVGAHYLVPTGIALHAVHAVIVTRRRPVGTPRQLALHTPTLGLLVVMALGAMIILDEVTGRYGMYNPPTLLLHGITGAFLFLVPTLRLADARLDDPLAPWLARQTGPLALGVLVFAAGAWAGTAVSAAGLAILGAGLLWTTLRHPGVFRLDPFALLRLLWAVPALVLLHGAFAVWRGMAPAEAPALATAGALSVLLLAGLPELMLRLTLGSTRSGPYLLGGVAGLITAGAIVLAGHALESLSTVQIAALYGLGGVLALAVPPRRA